MGNKKLDFLLKDLDELLNPNTIIGKIYEMRKIDNTNKVKYIDKQGNEIRGEDDREVVEIESDRYEILFEERKGDNGYREDYRDYEEFEDRMSGCYIFVK